MLAGVLVRGRGDDPAARRIGITWEHEAHEFFKRAHGAALLLGAPATHRARPAADLGFTETA
ncbi:MULTISPECIES: hypothetical protein [unclassified Streptomyces]|uniref:hypothetical protein n=1 Tax=unclassified Streptomyces TaxID=2593676 RepID=UPI001F2B30E0|nr:MULTISPECIES: hypothetical protein [unclassified Streptomyces]